MAGTKERTRRRGRGRRGTALEPLVQSRVRLLMARAQSCGAQGRMTDADRCVDLALRLCTRYNLRLPPHERALVCRRCRLLLIGSGRTRVRVRGQVVRTCLRCGRRRRKGLHHEASGRSPAEVAPVRPAEGGGARGPGQDI